jgi:acetyltransferase
MSIQQLDAESARAALPELMELLVDSVNGGASVGYLAPLDPAQAEHYWQGILASLSERALLVLRDGERIVGTVQVVLESRPNGNHRAEIAKMLVHSSARRRGHGQALMRAAEEVARAHQRTLLVLDTIKGDNAERMYTRLGFQTAGIIPSYARSSAGVLEPTVIMYKLLENGDQ